MATNRLFIFDPEANAAVCIGKGYSAGWLTGVAYVDDWFEDHVEYTGAVDKTRFQLITETELNPTTTVTYANAQRIPDAP